MSERAFWHGADAQDTHLVVGADARCAPAGVVAGRVRVVQLEAVVPVPPGVQERHTERPQTWTPVRARPYEPILAHIWRPRPQAAPV